jgi:hypothetical protein
MQRHLRGLENDIREAGFSGELLVSTTTGGCNGIEALVEKPIYTVGSGPAMAPIAGLTFSTLEGLGDNVVVATRVARHSMSAWFAMGTSHTRAIRGSDQSIPGIFSASRPSICVPSALVAGLSHGSTRVD